MAAIRKTGKLEMEANLGGPKAWSLRHRDEQGSLSMYRRIESSGSWAGGCHLRVASLPNMHKFHPQHT